jgi:SAM-dependent methyltransferase
MTHDEMFELGSSYDEMLQQGIGLSGETKAYFIDGRITALKTELGDTSEYRSILDFACGIGDSSVRLADAFAADVHGVDVAQGAIDEARQRADDERVRFSLLDDIPTNQQFDLCYVNGTYHHVPVSQQPVVTRRILELLRPGGVFALFENNPWSLPARLVMRRIPFDRDAVMLRPARARGLLADAGFVVSAATKYLFFFPSALQGLRRVEPSLRRVPLGAQYMVTGVRP